AHRGIRNTKLVAAIANIDFSEARTITGESYQLDENADTATIVAAILENRPTEAHDPRRRLPPEFKPFTSFPSARPFIRYLLGRGFRRQDVLRFTKDYG